MTPGDLAAAFPPELGVALAGDASVPPTFDVSSRAWAGAAAVARDVLGCTFFDWLSAVDELDDGFAVVCHVARHRPGAVEHLLLRTRLPREAASLETLVPVYRGAAWHERETHEMFGIDFTSGGTPQQLAPLLLPEEFEGHPLRKEFVLASRVAKPWPGTKEPGESGSAAHPARESRRRVRPPGVPTPEEWGPRDA